MGKVVEVQFDCNPHDLTPAQVEGILKTYDSDLSIDVGLGYQNKAAATFDADDDNAEELGARVAQTALDLGLTVTDVEISSKDEYEDRAWDESEVSPNG